MFKNKEPNQINTFTGRDLVSLRFRYLGLGAKSIFKKSPMSEGIRNNFTKQVKLKVDVLLDEHQKDLDPGSYKAKRQAVEQSVYQSIFNGDKPLSLGQGPLKRKLGVKDLCLVTFLSSALVSLSSGSKIAIYGMVASLLVALIDESILRLKRYSRSAQRLNKKIDNILKGTM